MKRRRHSGVIAYVTDVGTIVQVAIFVDGRIRWLAADGNLFRRAARHYLENNAAVPTLVGLTITLQQTDCGGLQSFAVTT